MIEQYKDTDGKIKLRLLPPAEAFHQEWNNFFSYYDLNFVALHPDKKPPLKKKIERSCLFCGESMPNVTFTKDAHTLAQFMGNRHMVSDFECDTCNSLFSKYETQLTYFLGLSRTLSFLKGQEGIPKFKTPDKKLEIGENKDEKKFFIISDGLENNHWEIDEEKKQMKIFSVKHPYVPVQCFKALLKIGLCYIDDEDIIHFKSAFKFLQTDKHDSKSKNDPIFRLYIHLFAGSSIPFPIIFRMKRKTNPLKENCPKYCNVIYFGNYIFQFFMPIHQPDIETFVKHKEVSLPACPPFLGEAYLNKHGIPKRGIFDLSSNTKVMNEKQVISMSFDSVEYKTKLKK